MGKKDEEVPPVIQVGDETFSLKNRDHPAEAAKAASQFRADELEPEDGGDLAEIFRSCVSHEEVLRRVMALAPCDLTRTEMNAVITLNAVGELAMTPLSECIGVSKEQASRAVKPLVERGYVERRRNENNRRVVTVQLTDAGREFLQGHMKRAHAALAELLAPLSAEERAELARLARGSNQLIDKALAPKRNPYEVE